MTTNLVITLDDDRDTKFIIRTTPVDTGECGHDHGSCGKPGAIAARNTLDQQNPTEVSTTRVTLCADHRADADRMCDLWAADARELQDPAERAAFLAEAGVTS